MPNISRLESFEHELTVSYVAMSASILRYFKPRDGLPDPNGSLSVSLPSQAIAAVNREVERTIHAAKGQVESQLQRICR